MTSNWRFAVIGDFPTIVREVHSNWCADGSGCSSPSCGLLNEISRTYVHGSSFQYVQNEKLLAQSTRDLEAQKTAHKLTKDWANQLKDYRDTLLTAGAAMLKQITYEESYCHEHDDEYVSEGCDDCTLILGDIAARENWIKATEAKGT